MVGNTHLEGTYSEVYPDVSQNEAGLKKLFTQFSFPERKVLTRCCS
jgi:xylulose-5-phosphate/fructose-6-phosphate phosphoketolase